MNNYYSDGRLKIFRERQCVIMQDPGIFDMLRPSSTVISVYNATHSIE